MTRRAGVKLTGSRSPWCGMPGSKAGSASFPRVDPACAGTAYNPPDREERPVPDEALARLVKAYETTPTKHALYDPDALRRVADEQAITPTQRMTLGYHEAATKTDEENDQ